MLISGRANMLMYGPQDFNEQVACFYGTAEKSGVTALKSRMDPI